MKKYYLFFVIFIIIISLFFLINFEKVELQNFSYEKIDTTDKEWITFFEKEYSQKIKADYDYYKIIFNFQVHYFSLFNKTLISDLSNPNLLILGKIGVAPILLKPWKINNQNEYFLIGIKKENNLEEIIRKSTLKSGLFHTKNLKIRWYFLNLK